MKRISFTYARWFERLFANLIDTMILLVPSGVLASAFGDAKGPLLMALFTLNIGYGVGFLSSNWQATPGKRLLGIYVIHADRSKLTSRDALERYLAYLLPSLPLYTSLISETSAAIATVWLSLFWFIPILTTPERTGLHDKICHTRVIAGKAEDGI